MKPGSIVLVTPDELRTIVADAVSAAFAEREPAASAPTLLDRRALAATIGVSVAKVDRMVRAGMPWIRVGAVKRFDLQQVREWCEGRTDGA